MPDLAAERRQQGLPARLAHSHAAPHRRALVATLQLGARQEAEVVATPGHQHLHARVRQIMRHTKSLALAQKQAGWARLHTECLSLSDDEAQQLMRGVPE